MPTPVSASPREGKWITKPQKPRWGASEAVWVIGGCVATYQFARLARRGTDARWLGYLGLAALALLALFVVGSMIRDLLARRERDADRALADASFGDQFPAEVTIVVGSDRIGTDRGAVWFADGLMGFSGSSASFVLAARDLAPQWTGVRLQSKGRQLPSNAIVLRNAPRPAHLLVSPLLGHAKPYRERLARLIADADDPEGERHWPPLVRYEAQDDAPNRMVRR